MTTITAPVGRSTLSSAGVIRSEWIKLRSVRSTFWTFGVALLATVGIGMIVVLATSASTVPTADDSARVLADAATIGVQFSQLVVAVLGVLVISGEYATGMIRSTLVAVPGRTVALAAKAVVLFVAVFVLSIVSSVIAFAAAYAPLAAKGYSASILHPTVLSTIFGAALFLGLLALFALGIGTVLRSSAGGIATVLGILLLLPTLVALIPVKWITDLYPFLIGNAGINMWHPESSSLDPWQNLLIMLAWVVAALGGGAILLRRRDA